MSYDIKLADSDTEFEQIFALNYQTFVEEIPQHQVNEAKTLRDKFHADNSYIICKDGEKIAGMVACCDKRPFSLDAKVDKLDSYLPPHKSVCELRLLAVQKEYRRTRIPALLLSALCKHLLSQGVDLAVISGTVLQLSMYEKLGFRPFYQLVGKEGAWYQPMYITARDLRSARWLK
jgi:ribosomal protein S18 acetylase RimI-like enzyme